MTDAIIYFTGALLLPLIMQVPIYLKKKKLFIACIILDIILAVLLLTATAVTIMLGYDILLVYIIIVLVLYGLISSLVLNILLKKNNVEKRALKIGITFVYPLLLIANQVVRIILVGI